MQPFDIFDNDAFRTRYDRREKRRPINRALFEAWGVVLAHRLPEEIDQLVHHQKRLRYKFSQLMNQDIEI